MLQSGPSCTRFISRTAPCPPAIPCCPCPVSLLAAGIVHLSALNVHIKTILDMQARRGEEPGWHLPRHASGAACAAAALAGVSSFAFQGTNAHALVRQAQGARAVSSAARLAAWARQRLWVAPPVHAMLQSAAAVAGRRSRQQQLLLEGFLSAPRLAFLWEHTVVSLPLLPASAFLELGTAAAGILLNSGNVANVALASSLLNTPLVLRGVHTRQKASTLPATARLTPGSLVACMTGTQRASGHAPPTALGLGRPIASLQH